MLVLDLLPLENKQMPSDFFNELKKLFEKLPGIGPRQAARFIWAMVDFAPEERKKMSELVSSLDNHLSRCGECLRIFNKNISGAMTICSFCHPNSRRDCSKIMVVERDSDLLNIEKSGAYSGLYHVLGGLVDPLEENQKAREGIKKLHMRIAKKHGAEAKEIILALSPTKLGEFTGNYIIKILEPLSKPASPVGWSQNLKISRLARGLSTGADLEYADEITLRQALDNRK